MPKLSQRSRDNLKFVHHDLVLVIGHAIINTPIDFVVIEGARTVERQKALIEAGASSLKDPSSSRHVRNPEGLAHAIDLAALVDGDVRWDWPLYARIADHVKKSAKDLGIAIEWGGDWTHFKDGPHFQLPRREYP